MAYDRSSFSGPNLPQYASSPRVSSGLLSPRQQSTFLLIIQPLTSSYVPVQAVSDPPRPSHGHRLSVPLQAIGASTIPGTRPLSMSLPAQRSSARSNGSSPSSSPKSQSPPIFFYDKSAPHYAFTNFSPHPVRYNGEVYPTSEHLFQFLKFEHRPRLATHIRTCSRAPRVAFSEAQRFEPEKRSDWRNISIAKMEETVFLKFTQHEDLKDELLRTGNAELNTTLSSLQCSARRRHIPFQSSVSASFNPHDGRTGPLRTSIPPRDVQPFTMRASS